MLDCMILGDSIAVGTAKFAPNCAVYAKGGWNSWQWNKKFLMADGLRPEARHVIISLGSNDYIGVNTERELETLRINTKADRVYWILPAIKPEIQDIVRQIAKEYGDIVIPIKGLSPDSVHPTVAGYKQIVKEFE